MGVPNTRVRKGCGEAACGAVGAALQLMDVFAHDEQAGISLEATVQNVRDGIDELALHHRAGESVRLGGAGLREFREVAPDAVSTKPVLGQSAGLMRRRLSCGSTRRPPTSAMIALQRFTRSSNWPCVRSPRAIMALAVRAMGSRARQAASSSLVR